jgi:DNA-3-methyladenine glycosylase
MRDFMKILPSSFFDRPVLEVCPELLGKYLVIKRGTKEAVYMITEIEAYD